MESLKKETVAGFNGPNKLPESEAEAKLWQQKNYLWWQENPMRYDWKDEIPAEEFSKDFYLEIDRRFFGNAEEYLNGQKNSPPFDEFVHFSDLKNKDVLEIGVGNGSHAQLLALSSEEFAGIDLTDYAVKSTRERFKIFGLKGDIRKMDAEKMEFPDNSFDFVWSWGVIHHSSNTRKVLEEIKRVLRPSGKAVIMVYHRGWWNYYVTGLLRGLINSDFLRGKTLVESVQLNTDGALARYFSFSDWKRITKDLFKIEKMETRGPKTDIILLPPGEIKSFLMKALPMPLSRFLTREMRMGVFLISRLHKLPEGEEVF